MARGGILSDRAAEICEQMLGGSRWRIVGTGSHALWLPGSESSAISSVGHAGIIDWSVADRMVVVRSGTTIEDLRAELGEQGQMIPVSASTGTVGGLLSMGLPHAAEAKYGPVKDWVLGMTVLLGDGTVAKVGSRVAKSVAGYDIHRALVGARGGLGMILDVNLKTFPLADLHEAWAVNSVTERWIKRTLPAHFDEELAAEPEVLGLCRETSTYLLSAKPKALSPGWWIGPGGTASSPMAPSLEAKLKQAMDPKARWEEGWKR